MSISNAYEAGAAVGLGGFLFGSAGFITVLTTAAGYGMNASAVRGLMEVFYYIFTQENNLFIGGMSFCIFRHQFSISGNIFSTDGSVFSTDGSIHCTDGSI